MGTTASFFFMGKFNTELSSTKKERKVGCHAPARELSYHSSSSLAGASLAPWSASVLWPNQPFLCVLLLLRESSSEPHRPPAHSSSLPSLRIPCPTSATLPPQLQPHRHLTSHFCSQAARSKPSFRMWLWAPGLEIPGPGNRMYCK